MFDTEFTQDMFHIVVKAIKNNLHIDFMKKEDAKPATRLTVKNELRGKVNIQ
jgi:type I restriction enzyme, R subunit